MEENKDKDRLRQFVKDHRDEFDAHQPPEKVWKGIEAKLPSGKGHSKRRWPLYSIAAAVSLILLAGIWWFRPSAEQEKDNLLTISPRAAEQQVQYISLIESKRDELKAIQREDPELYQEFASEIAKLDQDYNKLKAELDETPNQERIVEAMIHNLQAQINLLNQQLSIIRRLDELKKETNHENKTI